MTIKAALTAGNHASDESNIATQVIVTEDLWATARLTLGASCSRGERR